MKIAPDRYQRLRKYLRRLASPAWLGTIRRTTPLSQHWGYDRGTPIDRYYIERFLEEHRRDIHGRVLEVKDSDYTDRYGVGVERCDVLDIDPGNQQLSICADLATADSIPSDTFDCFILSQTLLLIYDVRSAIFHAHRILRPGGVLLVTVPAVSKMCSLKSDYWRFTVASCSALFGEAFGSDHITVKSNGNVLAAVAFLTGMGSEELSRRELDMNDQQFPVTITVRATKQRNR